MKFCNKCNAENKDSAKFCDQCGTKFEQLCSCPRSTFVMTCKSVIYNVV